MAEKQSAQSSNDSEENQKTASKSKTSAKPKCGIIMPISEIDGYSATHWTEVKEVLLEVISQTEFEGDLVSNSNEIRIIHETIVQNIYFNEMVICDVSGKNPNVMFELGLRIAFDKPVIVIKDDDTNYSFDTSPIEHLSYPTDLNYRRINQFKSELKSKIKATYERSKAGSPYLKSFGKFEVAGLDTKEIPSEEYIIKSLDELKKEVQSFRQTISNNNDGYNTSAVNKEKHPFISDVKVKRVMLIFKSKKDYSRALEILPKYLNSTDGVVGDSDDTNGHRIEIVFTRPILESGIYAIKETLLQLEKIDSALHIFG